jgi:Flp pilus assembly pilin Flp
MALFVRLLQDEEGATIVEYALCLATFSLVTIIGMYALVTGANGEYTTQTSAMNTYQQYGP